MNDGTTPLYIAATHPDIRDKEKLVRALIDAGATVGLGESPFNRKDKMEPGVVKMITGVCTQYHYQFL